MGSIIITCKSDDDSSDEDCAKIIEIPQGYFIGNQYYTNIIEQEVPCDFPEPEEVEILQSPPELENFTYEVLLFEYIADTGNNSSSWKFEIQLNNNNDFDVNGVPVLTILNDDGIQSTGSYSGDAIEPCYSIDANANCILTYDQEFPDIGLGGPESLQLIDVKYYLTN
ncbi:hypothetical protein GCM10009117_14310 [Gangjinia marincola]|uniref:Uncharacterized protein n=1 Tax=Gangjinia marincola TaxID=578463 RepID=A0ABP3XS92_9FLAO